MDADYPGAEEVARIRDLLAEIEDGRAYLVSFVHGHPAANSPIQKYTIEFMRPDPRLAAYQDKARHDSP